MSEFENISDKELKERAYKSLEKSEEILKMLGDLNFVVVGSKNDPSSGLVNAMKRAEENFEKQLSQVREEFKTFTADIKEIKEDVAGLKMEQSNQKTGVGVIKWLVGGGVGLALIGKIFNEIIK